jgi:hypothetical protein
VAVGTVVVVGAVPVVAGAVLLAAGATPTPDKRGILKPVAVGAGVVAAGCAVAGCVAAVAGVDAAGAAAGRGSVTTMHPAAAMVSERTTPWMSVRVCMFDILYARFVQVSPGFESVWVRAELVGSQDRQAVDPGGQREGCP